MNAPPTPLSTLKGRRVLVTGHTGFKGSWASLWLHRLGADVVGVALPPKHDRDFFNVCGVEDLIDHRIADIRNPQSFAEVVADVDADLVIHMAAQSLVRQSYEEPLDTYLTNVVGAAAVLDAARKMPSLKGVIVVTSDKCYENNEWPWGYRENDPMGGADPYSSSKGCTELVAHAYRRSFFQDDKSALVATVRAGNVIGGGDWSADRLVPDIAKATIENSPVEIRNPAHIRPWQHVLEPLWGYLLLAERLLASEAKFASGWNFGPDTVGVADVKTIVALIQKAWDDKPTFNMGAAPAGPHEAQILRLDSTKAKTQLGWRPLLSLEDAVTFTVQWYDVFSTGSQDITAFSNDQIKRYTELIEKFAPDTGRQATI